ncbi:MAG: SDR family oxidoreductase [Planctomycetota bacterium]
MTTYLVTGANRGIGLALAKQLAGRQDIVLGTARDPGGATEAFEAGVEMLELDVADAKSVVGLAEQVGDRPIDVLINNAGVYNDKAGLEETDVEKFNDCMRVNVAGPLAVTMALLPKLEHGGKQLIVNISSVMGSIGETRNGGSLGYRASKAALNMLTKAMAVELAPRGIGAVCVHPGWVETDMGGQGADLRPEESANHLVVTMDGLTTADTGRFIDYKGQDLPW